MSMFDSFTVTVKNGVTITSYQDRLINIGHINVSRGDLRRPASRELERNIATGKCAVFNRQVDYDLGMTYKDCAINSYGLLSAFKGTDCDLSRLGIGVFLGYYRINERREPGFEIHAWLATKTGEVVDTWVPAGTHITYVGVNLLQLQKERWKDSPCLKGYFEEALSWSTVVRKAELLTNGHYARATKVLKRLKRAPVVNGCTIER